jgi:hypothetical protein
MSWYAYHISPIDMGWEYLPTVGDFVAKIKKDVPQFYSQEYLDRIVTDFEKAQELAEETGWEGDFRHDPCVFFLPGDVYLNYGFVWKQDNNGNTFVVSPRPLFWLEQLNLTTTVIDS